MASRQTATLRIKNMVCDRCIRVVREELERLGIDVKEVELGEVTVARRDLAHKMQALKKTLESNGFELIGDKNAKLAERIKAAVIEWVRGDGDLRTSDLAALLSGRLGHEYRYLSRMFSSLENVTLEQYIILQKIERVKELLVYGEITLTEIAYRLGYSSVQYLSNQFKQITGFSPSAFKHLKNHKRKALDRVTGG